MAEKKIKTVGDSLKAYYQKQTKGNKEELKWALIHRLFTAQTNTEMGAAKFVLENMFDWKNSGAMTKEVNNETIKVEMVKAKDK